MKSVFIIRHAKSSWDEPDLPDVVRPLSNRGKKASKIIGQYLAKLHEKPDLMISSPASRAYHTATNVAQILGYRLKSIAVQPEIYFEGEQGVLNVLRNLEDKYENIFIFGHEPTCSDITETLCGQVISKFATASIAKIDLNIDKWKDIYQSKGKLNFFISPRQIKDH